MYSTRHTGAVIGDDVRVRHLSEEQALAVLGRGSAIEQLLPAPDRPEVIEWLTISPRSAEVCVIRHRVHKASTPEYRDVYEFASIDPDEEYGEGVLLGCFADAVEAFAAAGSHGARPDRWVNQGLIQDEAADATPSD